MRGLGPRIHVFAAAKQEVDGRNKSGHDESDLNLRPAAPD